MPKVVVAQVAVSARDYDLSMTPGVRCEACVASAQTARFGEASIPQRIDVNALTTLQLGAVSLVRLTSVQPFSLLFRTRF